MSVNVSSVEGGELFDRVISIGKFTEPTAKFLFYQMLTAVKVPDIKLYIVYIFYYIVSS